MLDIECERLRFTAFGEIWNTAFWHFFASALNTRDGTCGGASALGALALLVCAAAKSAAVPSYSSIISSARETWRWSIVLPFTGDCGADDDADVVAVVVVVVGTVTGVGAMSTSARMSLASIV